jgi:hypothetical protein
MKKLIAVAVIVASAFLIEAAPADARVVVGTRVYIGGGWGPYWGPWGYPYYPYPYPYAYPPPAYAPVYAPPIVTEPQSYIQQAPVIESAPPAPSYWYFCEGAKAYYPYVKECPGGWMTVVPPPAPEPSR